MNILADLNDIQKDAVTNYEGPSLILSGAGSGKTRVLTYRIAYMIQQGIRPWNILAVAFTNKAAKEIIERIENLIGLHGRDVWAGTFHAMFAKILRKHCHLLGYEKNFNIYDTSDAKSLIKTIIENEYKADTKKYNPNVVRGIISNAKNRLLFPDEYDNQSSSSPYNKVISECYTTYQSRLKQNNAMDFDDLISLPVILFQRYPEILEGYQKKLGYILVDEYQDTNHAQYRLINLLAKKHRNICVVGDDDQSIYSFRGADISNILNFEKDYSETKIYKLEQNYRSTQTILKAASDVVRNNDTRKEKTIWTANPEGEKITLTEAYDERDEASQVLTSIKKEMNTTHRTLNDFAVFYRTNAQSRVIEEALRRDGLPYRVYGGLRFYDRKEIKDVIAYLKILVNPRDRESFKRMINCPPRRIGKASVKAIEAYSIQNDISMLKACQNPERVIGLSPRAYKAVSEFYNDISEIKNLSETLPLHELIMTVVRKFRFIEIYEEDGSDEALIRRDNIQELLEGIEEFVDERDDTSLTAFLEEVSLMTDIDQADESAEAITLMTAHSAKGLEFPIVFVTGLEDGLFPINYENSVEKVEKIEEERRLFYVAVTRAREKLYLHYAKHRRRFSYDFVRTIKSRFLHEIADEVLDDSSVRSRYGSIPRRKSTWPMEQLTPQLSDPELSVSDATERKDASIEPQRQFKKGTEVYHDIFGLGTVIKITGNDEKAKLTIHFRSAGVKRLVSKYAGLEVID